MRLTRTLVGSMPFVALGQALAQTAPSVRRIAAPDAKTAPVLASPAAVRTLRDGGILVNDARRRQLLRFDASLATFSVIADSAAGTMTSYGGRAGGFIRYIADSTLFVDPAGLTMFVIDPDGRIARTASIPRSQDAPSLTAASEPAAVDAHGRIVYREAMRMPQNIGMGATSGQTPDSLEIVRLDMKTRKLDTAGWTRQPKVRMTFTQTEKGMSLSGVVDAVPIVDGWTVLTDGTIAIVRGLDYHVDFVGDDGVAAGPKIPFEWRHLSDDEKITFRDSIVKSMQHEFEPGAAPGTFAMMHGAGHGAMQATMTLVPASELPDYVPPFGSGAVFADADDHLWVHTTLQRSNEPGIIYDVIDRKGQLIDRVQLPPARDVVGFGAGGIVYLVARDAGAAWIERTHR